MLKIIFVKTFKRYKIFKKVNRFKFYRPKAMNSNLCKSNGQTTNLFK